jgi:hypothetical protein
VLVYIEFITRLQGVSLEAFHFAAGRQEEWSSGWEDDVLLLNIGRTFRTGPEPEYLAVWYTPGAGLERIGDWERVFKAHEADELEEHFKLGARIEKAGSYEPLLEPLRRRDGLYYVEYLDFAPEASRDDVRDFYTGRRDRGSEIELNLLCDRIGKLAPDPRALAVWNVGEWDRLGDVARELDGVESPVRLVTAGIYRDLGQETL